MPPAVLLSIEQTAISTWLRDSTSIFGYWFVLSWHALGMGALMGVSMVVAGRVLGVGRDLPMTALHGFYRVIWVGFWIQVVSGVLLLIAYPTKCLTAPAFYIKLLFIGAGMTVMVKLERQIRASGEVQAASARRLALWSLLLWLGALTAGRFIAYTYKYATYPS